MPPPVIRSIKDIIFWQYAKIISESANYGKSNYGFIMSKFIMLKKCEINWSTAIREYIKERENINVCIYCGVIDKLTHEHILPRSRGGEDIPDNSVFVCKSCKSSKGDKRLYEWKGLKNKDEHHRISEGKYLKYLYNLHEKRGTLYFDNVKDLCINCDMGKLCEKENTVEKLSVYCLEGCFKKI